MPRKAGKVPSYCHHKASRQAVVRIDGHDHYLGPYGSADSYSAYERLVGEWRVRRQEAARGGNLQAKLPTLTIADIVGAYLKFARCERRSKSAALGGADWSVEKCSARPARKNP